jgi:zinc transporter ZupT
MHHVMFADFSEQVERHHQSWVRSEEARKSEERIINVLLTMLLIHTLPEGLRLGVVSSAWNKLAR